MAVLQREAASADSKRLIRLKRIAWLEPFWVTAVGVITVIPPRFAPAAWQPHASAWRPFLIALLLLDGRSVQWLIDGSHGGHLWIGPC